MSSKVILGIFLLVLIAISSLPVLAYPDCADCGVCQQEYRPVCGSNGLTYHNACQLGCEKRCRTAGLKVAHDGECQSVVVQQ